MSGHIGLYYPFIHFRDESWLKLTSLYWDRMGRIVPEDYGLRDSDTVRQFKDSGYVRNFHPGGAQARPGLAFRELLATHGDQLRESYGLHLSANWPDDPATVRSRAAHFGDKRLAYVFGPKIAPELIQDLEALGLAEQRGLHDPRWVGMHPKLANLYMVVLAEAMATPRGAQPVTSDTLSHVGIGDFTMERLAGALLDDITDPPAVPGHEVEQQMADLTIKMVVPANLDDLPVEKLVAFRARYPGERAAFQQQMQAMVASLDTEGIRDPEALRDHLQVQYETLVQPQLADLEQRLHDARIDTTTALTNVKTQLPAGLAAGAGLLMLHSGQPVVGTGAVALGVWGTWQDQRRARRKALGALPASAYLYHIGTDLRPADLASRINQLSRRFLPRRAAEHPRAGQAGIT